ncbi:nuclear pore complex protein NUP98A isoform X1 [Iris pallida]|uniref:Nuclear pore complex protein NUP98A isoform X1 n=1 Tax=Iris pallida TaxID=29817 RepID=A0AAX6F4E6_IRIPA|nr:nuclear pore complex protein NUP98A isoform X1 [Iris pallida]
MLVKDPSFGLISTPSQINYSTKPAFGSTIQQTQPSCGHQTQPRFGSKSFDSTTLCLLLVHQVAYFLVSQAPMLFCPNCITIMWYHNLPSIWIFANVLWWHHSSFWDVKVPTIWFLNLHRPWVFRAPLSLVLLAPLYMMLQVFYVWFIKHSEI